MQFLTPPCWTPRGSRVGWQRSSPPACQGVPWSSLRWVRWTLQRRAEVSRKPEGSKRPEDQRVPRMVPQRVSCRSCFRVPWPDPRLPLSIICPTWPNWWRRHCRGSPRVILTHLQSPLGVPSRWVVPRSSKASGKKPKHPALAGTPRMLKTSLRDSMTPRKCKKMVVC